MDTARYTDERLRTALNANQSSRERMCLAVLALDRNYTDACPRRPEGGRDGSRDLQCLRNSQICFGAVGFVNNVCDSARNKTWTKRKFRDDAIAALTAQGDLSAFVFFTNVDLTPTEVEELREWGKSKGLSFVDIYWRERIRHVLDSAEGLAIRYQYLALPLSEAEQASFFSRFGSDLERLVRGRFDSIERKIDNLEFLHWKTGKLSSLLAQFEFREEESACHLTPEHFRILIELLYVSGDKSPIVLGCQDDFKPNADGTWHFGVKNFIWRESDPPTEPLWLSKLGLSLDDHNLCRHTVSQFQFGCTWIPRSPIHIETLEGLRFCIFATENIATRLSSVKLTADSQVVYEQILPQSWGIRHSNPVFSWPGELTADEKDQNWCRHFGRSLNLEKIHLK